MKKHVHRSSLITKRSVPFHFRIMLHSFDRAFVMWTLPSVIYETCFDDL